jgi:hypothetical protein
MRTLDWVWVSSSVLMATLAVALYNLFVLSRIF